MRFRYHSIPELPRLSWCAVIKRRHPEVHIYHGPWVETRAAYFFEGAWDGPFEEGRFDRSQTFLGSGGRAGEGEVLFSAPTNTFHWLLSKRAGDSLWISNSLVFLLVQSGDGPALDYPYYSLDVLKSRRWGLQNHDDHFYSAAGHRINLHKWENYLVTPELRIERRERARPAEFNTFTAYENDIRRAVSNVFTNASAPGRKIKYRPLASISSGYDSTTGAALAAGAGCREAFTFLNSKEQEVRADSGVGVAAHLGMQLTEYDRWGYLDLPGMPEAEFAATPSFGTGVTYACLEPQVEKTLLLTGFHGDGAWGVEPEFNMPNLMYPTARQGTASSINEFRLRVGFIHFTVPFIGAIHKSALQKISDSEELQPWAQKESYNRPIARRIIEEAGVPGELFGQVKRATGHTILQQPDGMKEESRKDFLDFYQGCKPSYRRSPFFQRLGYLILDLLYGMSRRLPDRQMRLYRWLLPLTLHSDRFRWKYRQIKYLYLFHWGFEKIKHRYVFTDPGTQ